MAQIPTAPPFLKGVLGKNADVREIPETSAVGEGRLNFNSGFPAENALPPSAGGVAPQREDFNAVNKLVTQHLYWLQAGGCYPWRDDLDYIKGCHAMGSDDKEYICQRWCGPGSTAGAKDPTDSESGNYWWAPAEETQIATNTAAIEELTKTVSTAVSDVTEAVAKVETVSTQVNTNTSDITSLKGRVTANEGGIDKLESRMDTAEGNVTSLTGRMDTAEDLISDNSNDIASLTTRMTSAEENISDNATDIAGLTTRMTAAEGTISTHTSDISGLASRVSTNEINIKSNTDDIESLASSLSSLKNDVDTDEEIIASNSNRIAANEGSIATNTSDIATLKTNVSTNTSDLTALTTRVTTAEGDIDSLEGRMTTAEGNISDNASAISTNTDNIATNASDIAALKTRVTTNEGSIKTNQTDISTLKTAVSGNATAIAANAKSISTNASNISTLDGRVTTAEGEIDTLQSDLTSLTGRVSTNEGDISGLKTTTSTNTTNIKTNADDIAALKTDVTANTTNISTNAENISTLQTQVATNTSDIAALSGDTSITEKLTELQGLVETNTTNLSAAVTRIDDVTNWESTAQMHNNIYRGANLLDGHFSSIADIMTAVSAGDFSDIYLGDYVTATYDGTNTTKYRVAAINLLNARSGTWGTTKPNVCIVPDGCGTSYMNSTNTAAGAYVSSYMYKTKLPALYKTIGGNSGSPFYGHVLSTTESFANATSTSMHSTAYSGYAFAESGWTEYTTTLCLMSPVEIYGNRGWGTSQAGQETIAVQLPMFAINPASITLNGTIWFWTRSVASSDAFCGAGGVLGSGWTDASNAVVVRPRFFIG